MLTQQLERCNRFISIDPINRSVFVSHYDNIRNSVINQMKKEDELFNEIFHETKLSGSYADQLKVSKPNEYDVLIILELPDPIVRRIRRKPGYVQINVRQQGCCGIERILDSEGYLMQNKVLEWLRKIMKRIFPYRKNALEIGNHKYNVSCEVNGPANTLHIQDLHNETTKFSIDFVGALEFQVKKVWMADADAPKECFLESYWNAIPRPRKKPTKRRFYSHGQVQRYSTDINTDVNTLQQRQYRNLNRNRAWMCSYAAIERELIHDSQFIKPLIRIFKKIRDTHEITNLKSYYIKHIFIHQIHNSIFCKQSLGELFLKMFDFIVGYLKRRHLPFFWHKKFNLFHHFKRKQIDDMERKFRRIKQDIDMHQPDCIYKAILNDTEQRQISQFD